MNRQRPVTTERFEDYLKSHLREHKMLRSQIKVAAENVDRRLAEMNEMRAQINSERGLSASRELHDALAAKVAEVETRQAEAQKATMTWILAITLFLGAIQAAVHFL
jgi:response regulator of citrate/malate metabolism